MIDTILEEVLLYIDQNKSGADYVSYQVTAERNENGDKNAQNVNEELNNEAVDFNFIQL